MPTLTLAGAELRLASRAGAYLASAGIPADGPSPVPAFQDGIAEALAWCGCPATDPSAVTDTDVARLPAAGWPRFLDVAELRLLETAGAALMVRPQSQRWTNYRVGRDLISFQLYLDARRRAVRLKWGFGVAPLAPGTIAPNGAARCGEF